MREKSLHFSPFPFWTLFLLISFCELIASVCPIALFIVSNSRKICQMRFILVWLIHGSFGYRFEYRQPDSKTKTIFDWFWKDYYVIGRIRSHCFVLSFSWKQIPCACCKVVFLQFTCVVTPIQFLTFFTFCECVGVYVVPVVLMFIVFIVFFFLFILLLVWSINFYFLFLSRQFSIQSCVLVYFVCAYCLSHSQRLPYLIILPFIQLEFLVKWRLSSECMKRVDHSIKQTHIQILSKPSISFTHLHLHSRKWSFSSTLFLSFCLLFLALSHSHFDGTFSSEISNDLLSFTLTQLTWCNAITSVIGAYRSHKQWTSDKFSIEQKRKWREEKVRGEMNKKKTIIQHREQDNIVE